MSATSEIAARMEPMTPDELELLARGVLQRQPFHVGDIGQLVSTVVERDRQIEELREAMKGRAVPVRVEITPKDIDKMIRARGAAFVAVVEAGIAALHATANADGKVYVVDCAAWDALEAALRPFMPKPDPELPL